jgi:hypothetical protein
VDKWDRVNIKCESELSKLEMLIEDVKLGGNLFLCFFLEVNYVRLFGFT